MVANCHRFLCENGWSRNQRLESPQSHDGGGALQRKVSGPHGHGSQLGWALRESGSYNLSLNKVSKFNKRRSGRGWQLGCGKTCRCRDGVGGVCLIRSNVGSLQIERRVLTVLLGFMLAELYMIKHFLPLCLVWVWIANAPTLTKSPKNYLMRLKGRSQESRGHHTCRPVSYWPLKRP